CWGCCSWGHIKHSSHSKRGELMPKSLILVSSDHITFSQSSLESFKCPLATCRRPCTCAFLSRGTLRVLQNFNHCGVVCGQWILGDFGPSCLEIIHKLPLCSSGVILHLSDDHRYRTRGYLAWSPRPRAIDSCLVLLPFANKSHQ